MSRLLRQNWYVARKSFLLWLICIVMFVISAISVMESRNSFNAIIGLGFVYTFLAAVQIGNQGTSGSLDDQIITGSSRFRIYMANFLVLFFSCLLILGCTLLGDLAGSFAGGDVEWDYEIWGYLYFVLGEVANTAAYASILTLIGMLIISRRASSGTITLIVAMSVVFAMTIWGFNLNDKLSEPEMISYIEYAWYTEDEDPESPAIAVEATPEAELESKEYPNPFYVSEPLRSQYMRILEFLPITQSMIFIDAAFDTPAPDEMGPLYTMWMDAGILILGCGVVGTLLFKRRQLN